MTAVRLARNAFVRRAPDADAAPLGLARRGDRLTAFGTQKNGWLAVEWNGRVGWVWGRLAEKESRIAKSAADAASSQWRNL